MTYNAIEIMKERYGNFAIIDGEKLEVFENVSELVSGWAFNEFESDEIETAEIDLIENMCQDSEYFAGDVEYIRCWGNGNGEFFVKASENYTVFVVYVHGFPEACFETEEEAEEYFRSKFGEGD